MKHMAYHSLWKGCLALILAVAFLSCSDYEYSSPLPGILEVRLRVKNERPTIIPFSDRNVFNIILKDFVVQRDDGAFLVLLGDLHAISRKDGGDTLNCLNFAARDSQVVLGTTYAPPGTYVSLISERSSPITHDSTLFRFDGAAYQEIPVRDKDNAPPSRFTMMAPTPSIEVKEGKTTLVVLTLDLDASLLRRSEWFDWVAPMVFVSSVQMY